MLLDLVSASQMRAGQVVTGLTMAAFLAAPVFGKSATNIRIAVTGLYILAGLVFLAYLLISS